LIISVVFSLQLIKNFWSKFYLRRWKLCLQTLWWRLQWCNSNATGGRGNATAYFRCSG